MYARGNAGRQRTRSRPRAGAARTLLACAALVLSLGLPAISAGPAEAVIAQTSAGTVSYQPLARAKGPLALDFAFSNLDYNGGPVMSSNTNYAVYWSPSGASAYPTGYIGGIDQYFEGLAHDSGGLQNVDSISSQYNDAAGEFARYESHFGGAIVDEHPYPANGCSAATTCLTDAQLRAELVRYVGEHALPHDLGHEYFLLTPANVEDCFSAGGGECSAGSEQPYYCAYHGAAAMTGGTLVYSNDPYVTGNALCDDGEHPNAMPSDGVLNGGLTHEHNESITDPEPNSAWTDFATGGTSGYEIGDKCGESFGTPLGTAVNGAKYNQVIDGRDYFYQEEWSNQGHTCMQRLAFSGAEPAATFGAEDEGSGNRVKLDASASSAPGGVKHYSWQFNAEGGEPGAPFETTAPTTARTFPAPGTYRIALTVFGEDGTSVGTARTVAAGDENPTAAFAATGAPPVAGGAATFSAASSSDLDGAVASYAWSFGDGSSGGGELPSHVYAQGGSYTILLTVTDSAGLSAHVSHALVVAAPPPAEGTGEKEKAVGSEGGSAAGSGSGPGSAGGGATGPALASPPPTAGSLSLASSQALAASVSLIARRLVGSRGSRSAEARLACAGTAPCRGAVVLHTVLRRRDGRRLRVPIGAGAFSIAAGSSAHVAISLGRLARALLSSRGLLAATLTITKSSPPPAAVTARAVRLVRGPVSH